MGYFSNAMQKAQSRMSTHPIDCPRAWGEVTFNLSFETVLPWVSVERKCPISGSNTCMECMYPVNPDSFVLSKQLEELENAKQKYALTDEEYLNRRLALFTTFPPATTDCGFTVAAWVLGPLGVVFAGTGLALVHYIHPGFWGLVGPGAIMLALAYGFSGIATSRKENSVTANPDHREW